MPPPLLLLVLLVVGTWATVIPAGIIWGAWGAGLAVGLILLGLFAVTRLCLAIED